jgi:oligosaccharide repeat unit polymerase
MNNIKLNALLNPLILYILIWSLTALLISLKITKNLEDFSGDGALLIYITILSAITILFFDKYFLKKVVPKKSIDLFRLKKLTDLIFFFWIFLIFIYAVLAGGFGLIWIIKGIQVDYIDVQIPSLWGLNITLCYSLGCSYLYLLIKNKDKHKYFLILKFLVVLSFPVLIFSRNVMLQLFLQLTCIWLFSSDIKLKKSLIQIFLYTLVLIYLFGLVGDNRTVGGIENPFSDYILDDYKDIMSLMPSGFTWIYMYITANYNNILFSIVNSQPTNELYPIFMNLVPGALKELVFGEAITTNSVVSSVVKDANLTVASFYAGPIIAYGFIGGIISGILIQLVSLFWYRLALSKNFGYQLCYSSIFACIFFSIFYDAFFTMGTVTQLIIGVFIATYCKPNHKVVKY